MEVKQDKYIKTFSFVEYNEKELKNQLIKSHQILVISCGKKLNDILTLSKELTN